MTAPTLPVASMTLTECQDALARWQIHAAGAVSRTERRHCAYCIGILREAIDFAEAGIAADRAAVCALELHLDLTDDVLCALACGSVYPAAVS